MNDELLKACQAVQEEIRKQLKNRNTEIKVEITSNGISCSIGYADCVNAKDVMRKLTNDPPLYFGDLDQSDEEPE